MLLPTKNKALGADGDRRKQRAPKILKFARQAFLKNVIRECAVAGIAFAPAVTDWG